LSKITHFVAITKEILAEELTRLFRNNVWKLHRLSKSVVSDRGPQLVAELTKELNQMLEIKTKLLMGFHPQTNGQTERINQELEQYLRFFVDHKQKNWPVLWQPLITKTNDLTNGKSLSWISSGEFTRELDKESLLN